MIIDNDFWAKSNFLPFYPAVYRKLKSGVPAIDVMKLADHSSLDVTSIYVKHIDKTLCNKISKIAPKFLGLKKNIIFAEILIIYIYDFRRKFKPTFYR